MGPVTLALQLSSNLINAVLIKSTPGFGGVNIGQLVLLWATRPRLAWLAVVLIPWQADQAMYFGVAASNLVAEIILQLISSYYMGTAANYARRQRFYRIGHLDTTQQQRMAMTLYAGALLWLIVLFLALVSCFVAISGVDRHISAFKKRLSTSAWKARRQARAVRSRRSEVIAAF